jgi:DNA repair protein RecO (recombination protein O)
MSVRQAEAVVLRTWLLHEADQIVCLFTREYGKIKGIAKSAAKSRKRFGGALEPMTHVRATFVEKPRQELVRLDFCEVLRSPLKEQVDYARLTALDLYAEVLDETLADRDPNDTVFRLLLSVLDATRAGQVWLPVTYFSLWMTRLMGWLPDLLHCLRCGEAFAGRPAYFHVHGDGLFCIAHKQLSSAVLFPESQRLAAAFLHAPVSAFTGDEWKRTQAADLRRFAVQSLERHIDRKLRSAAAIARLQGQAHESWLS